MAHFIVTKSNKIFGIFETQEEARDHARELAFEEYKDGEVASHYTIGKWDGSADLGIVEHVYGWEENKRREFGNVKFGGFLTRREATALGHAGVDVYEVRAGVRGIGFFTDLDEAEQMADFYDARVYDWATGDYA